MARVRRLFTTPLPFLGLAGLMLTMATGSVAAVRLTEKPAFCKTCHEMTAYYDAWHQGPHNNVSCTDCHVDPGTVQKVEHKAVALKEVWIHLTGHPKFPKYDVDIPDSRCVACHTSIAQKPGSRFSHPAHVKQTRCITCHRDTGHKVTPGALAAGGVLAARNTTGVPLLHAAGAAETTSAAHTPIPCTSCHDLDKTACADCHTPPHAARGECQTCHAPGASWAFTHPVSTACATCHAPPANHWPGACTACHSTKVAFKLTKVTHGARTSDCASCHQPTAAHNHPGACTSCHTNAGTSWAFTHPSSNACASCHSAPATHFGTDCASCHTPGVAFKGTKYTHTSTACNRCHTPPSNHYHATCTTCHTPYAAFTSATFRHVTSGDCSACHRPPSQHRGPPCATCHRAYGTSWAFTHPGSTNCSACHAAPSNHFGTTCAQCHSPSRAWASATLNHPSLQHHTYQSFACANCHLNGTNKPGVCTKCHGPGGPGGD